jgi:hypothetical protein
MPSWNRPRPDKARIVHDPFALRTATTHAAVDDIVGLLRALYTYDSANDILTLGSDLAIADLLYVGGTAVPAGSPAKLMILVTGAVFGAAATGYTQIGHVATDILNITVGPTASGKVRVNNTTTSTSISTGAVVNAGGQGIAGPLWVGGLANIAGAVTLQSTLAITGAATLIPTGRTLHMGGLDGISYISGSGTNIGVGAGVVKSITLAANSCSAVGKGIRIRVAYYRTGGGSITFTLRLNGETIASLASANTSISFAMVDVFYTTSTKANTIGIQGSPGTSIALPLTAQLVALDWTIAQSLDITQDTVTSTFITVLNLTVEQIG